MSQAAATQMDRRKVTVGVGLSRFWKDDGKMMMKAFLFLPIPDRILPFSSTFAHDF